MWSAKPILVLAISLFSTADSFDCQTRNGLKDCNEEYPKVFCCRDGIGYEKCCDLWIRPDDDDAHSQNDDNGLKPSTKLIGITIGAIVFVIIFWGVYFLYKRIRRCRFPVVVLAYGADPPVHQGGHAPAAGGFTATAATAYMSQNPSPAQQQMYSGQHQPNAQQQQQQLPYPSVTAAAAVEQPKMMQDLPPPPYPGPSMDNQE